MREPVDLGQRHGLDVARRAGLVCRAHVGAQVACAELDLARGVANHFARASSRSRDTRACAA